ncbi:MAG: glycosyltransferase family 39 protein, partial [Caldilineaceae bacterium]
MQASRDVRALTALRRLLPAPIAPTRSVPTLSAPAHSAPAGAATLVGSDARTQTLASALVASAGLLLALLLRLPLLNAFPLRDDEALYSTWALAVPHDPFFLSTLPDKPPIFLWLQALALGLFGASPAGARLLSIGASVLAVALAAAIARRLWPQVGWGAGIVALWLLALSPFAIAFAPTAYTDSLLLLWLMLALAVGLRGRWLAAGAALGAAIMTKQQGMLFAPLVLLLPLVVEGARGRRLQSLAHALPTLLGGLALVLVPVLLWDASRWATAPSPWDLGVRNYAALGIAPPATWAARAVEWREPIWHLAASRWTWALLLGATAA